MLAVIGLGAYACVRSGSIENGWAFLGVVPILGLLIAYAVLRFRRPLPDVPLNALRGAVHAVLVGMTLLVCAVLVMNFIQRGSEIRGGVPNDFPILAVIPSDHEATFTAHIVPKRDIDGFARDHPDMSYLVPKHLEASLHENLRYDSEVLFQSAYFDVTEISADRQAFEVRLPIHSEAYTVGWYEATAQGIEPKRYLSFHEMKLGFVGIFVLVLSAIISSLLGWLLDLNVWPRLKPAESP